MARSNPSLYQAHQSLPLEQKAELARKLITANTLYQTANAYESGAGERAQALVDSELLATEVLKHQPNHEAALNLVARIELDKGHVVHARSLLNKALELNQENENTLINYGYLLIAQNAYDDAIDSFSRALSTSNSSSRAFAGIALAKLRKGDTVSAFAHYRRLLECGYDSTLNRYHFLESAHNIVSERYDPNLEALVLNAYEWDEQDRSKLAHLACTLIINKYDLRNEEAVLDLDALSQDELIIGALTHCLVPSIEVEALVQEIRKNILIEVSITQSLREELQRMVLAIGIYSARNDYILMVSEDEDLAIANICSEISSVTQTQWQQDDIVGALIIASMYEPLYTQKFSYKLLAYELSEWPAATQDLLNAALYELCEEHRIQFDLYGNTSESILNNDVRRCADRWDSAAIPNVTHSLHEALVAELGGAHIPSRFATETIKILMVGCGASQRGIYLSKCFDNVDVVAIDNNPYNVIYGRKMAEKHQATKLQIIRSSLEEALVSECDFDIIEFGEAINHVESPASVIAMWKQYLADDGLVRLNLNNLNVQENLGVVSQLVNARKLSPTTDNIRHLRHAILEEATSGLWEKLFQEERFYTGAGCKELFFFAHNHYFDLARTNKLLKDTGLAFVSLVDIPKHVREELNPMAPQSLMAWHAIEQDKALYTSAYQLYCTKA